MANEKRLTEKHYSGNGYYLNCSSDCPNDGFCDDCEKLYKAIDRLGEYEDKAEQTVDVVEVKHGRWIDNIDENGYLCNAWRKCSACGGLNWSKRPNYCPNCGAKMDGGNEDV